MALTKFTQDVAVISKLDDEPNDVGGLSAAALKAKFDEGGEAIKQYLNETLTEEVASREELQGLVLGQIPDGTVTAEKLSDKTMIHLKDGTLETLDGQAVVQHQRAGEIMLASSAVSNLPENVLPCTGGYYDKTAFPKLFTEIGYAHGTRLPAYSSEVSNTYTAYLYSGFLAYDRIRYETYVRESASTTTVYVLDKSMNLVRTFTLPQASVSHFQVYDGALAFNAEGSPDVFYVSLDGGGSFKYTNGDDSAYSCTGMSKTKIYFLHNTSSKVIVYDKITETFSRISPDSPDFYSNTASFTNDDYVFAYHGSGTSESYTQSLYSAKDEVDSSNIVFASKSLPSGANCLAPLGIITSFKNMFIGYAYNANSDLSSGLEHGDIIWNNPVDNTYGFLHFTAYHSISSIYIASKYVFSQLGDNSLALFPGATNTNYSGYTISAHDGIVSVGTLVISNGGDNPAFSFGVMAGSEYMIGPKSSTDGTMYLGSAEGQFRVPIVEIDNVAAYIYTGED